MDEDEKIIERLGRYGTPENVRILRNLLTIAVISVLITLVLVGGLVGLLWLAGRPV